MMTLTGVMPLTDARTRRRTTAVDAGLTGANQPAIPGATALPDAPLELGDARPYTPGPGPVPPTPYGDAVPYGSTGFTSSGPAGRAEGNPVLSSLTPQAPNPVPQPMPGGGASGYPLAGGYATTSAYGPGNDLRGTAILPGQSAAAQAATGAATNALGSYTGWTANPWTGVAAPGSYAAAGDTSALRGSLSQAIAALQNGPDRGQLAKQNFDLLDQTAREATNRDLRVIGQDAAKWGRIGSGLTTTNLADLGERNTIDRLRAQTGMSLDAAGQTMADRLNTAGAIQSGFGALSGADAQTAGINQSYRNEARGERDAANAYNAADFSRRGQLFGDVANYAQQQTVNDAANRAEARGERAYQGGMESQAYQRTLDAINAATGQSNNSLNQALALLNAGSGGQANYLNALGNAAQTATGQSAGVNDLIYQLLQQYGARAA
jgi:hypothetical protein